MLSQFIPMVISGHNTIEKQRRKSRVSNISRANIERDCKVSKILVKYDTLSSNLLRITQSMSLERVAGVSHFFKVASPNLR